MAGPDLGILLDDRFRPGHARCRHRQRAAGSAGRWRSPARFPVRFEGGADIGCTLREWPTSHVVKCLVFYHPDDPDALCAASRRRRCCVCSMPPGAPRTSCCWRSSPAVPKAPVDETTLARALERIYRLEIYPDWWKLPDPEQRDRLAESEHRRSSATTRIVAACCCSASTRPRTRSRRASLLPPGSRSAKDSPLAGRSSASPLAPG